MPTRPDGDPGKPGRLSEDPIDGPPRPAPVVLPRVNNLDFDRLAADAAPSDPSDPGYAGLVAREATRLDPLVKMQGSFAQIVGHCETIRRGQPFAFPGGFPPIARGAIAHATRCRDVLAVAHAKADAALSQITSELNALEQAMSDKREQEQGHPLTTDGSIHPLVEGGYDPDEDPQVRGEESASAGLKAGHTTHKQAEALAKSDTAAGSVTGGPGRPGTTAPPPTVTEAEKAKAGAPSTAPGPHEPKAPPAVNPLANPPADKK